MKRVATGSVSKISKRSDKFIFTSEKLKNVFFSVYCQIFNIPNTPSKITRCGVRLPNNYGLRLPKKTLRK